MFQRILVPLDGSERAQHALPVAIRLARASHGTMVLVHIVPAPSEVGEYGAEPEAMAAPPTSHEKRLSEAEQNLQHILDAYAHELRGIQVEREVETGATAETMFSIARLEHVDLIVICSHGAHHLLHWIFKSLAREAVHHSPVPVLVLKERGGLFLADVEPRRLRVLVPLDGSQLAEAALQPALHLLLALAAPGVAEMHLVRVIDLPSIKGKPLLRAYDIQSEEEQAEKEAERYMQEVTQRIAQHIPAEARPQITWSLRVSNHVGPTLADMAQEGAAGKPEEHLYDLIAMATHGRTGFQRWRMGSVTEHMLGTTELPLLVVPPPRLTGQAETGKEPEVMLGR